MVSLETEAAPDWVRMPNDELVRYIVKHYHNDERDRFPETLKLAKKVEDDYGSHSEFPRGLEKLLSEIFSDLDLHMLKEENILFPWMERDEGLLQVSGPIQCMMAEHFHHEENLGKLRDLCRNFLPPPGPSSEWADLYVRLAAFERTLMEHIHVENNVLFQRAVEAKANAGF